MLGDCYYLTAISALKMSHLTEILLLLDDRLSAYANRYKCGAYLCRFKIKGTDVYVIIDDRFPYCERTASKWVYGRCLEKTEIWCQVIEIFKWDE